MPTTINGYYENGRVVLDQQPPFMEKTKVKVMFQDEKPATTTQRKLGTLKGLGTVPNDFNEPLDELEEYT